MNEQKFVRIIGTTKDYIVFPDELGNFPETVQIAEPTKQTFENILEKTIDPSNQVI